jgi:hypothetical protein
VLTRENFTASGLQHQVEDKTTLPINHRIQHGWNGQWIDEVQLADMVLGAIAKKVGGCGATAGQHATANQAATNQQGSTGESSTTG